MNAEIISIGTELLLGHVVNTNAAFLSGKLAEAGIDVFHQVTVGDNPARLTAAILKALGRSDIVITSGGLGPTVDDITMKTVAHILKKPLVLDKIVLRHLKDYFRLRNVKFPKASIRQAYIPEGVTRVYNDVGTAPGVVAKYGAKIIICLPGPPREIVPMFNAAILPVLRKKLKNHWVIKSRTIKTTGLAESQVDGKVRDLLNLKPPTTVGIYAKLRQVELKIMAKAGTEVEALRNIAHVDRKIRSRLGDYVFGCDDETLEGAVGAILAKHGLTIATAESCTGGLLAHRLTNVAGSSLYFMSGVVTYSDESKGNLLGVSSKTIEKFGAVSKETALEMARGIKHFACVDIGIAITGIAGPAGGTAKKPAGLVFIALVNGKKSLVREFRFSGSREEVKFQASQAALDFIRHNI